MLVHRSNRCWASIRHLDILNTGSLHTTGAGAACKQSACAAGVQSALSSLRKRNVVAPLDQDSIIDAALVRAIEVRCDLGHPTVTPPADPVGWTSQALVDSCAAELKAAEVGKRDWETPLHQAQHAVEVWIGLDHKEPYPFPPMNHQPCL